MRRSTALLAAGVAALAAAAPAPATATVRDVLWLPLGDSITWGCTGPTIQDCHGFDKSAPGNGGSGYRIPLALALSEPPCGGCGAVGGCTAQDGCTGYNVSTMGTLSTGPPYTPTQWHRHEGHPGWQINTVDNILNKSLATSEAAPDLVTIHLGTNDCDASVAPSAMKDRMDSLLGHLFAAAPKAQVFLADVIGTGNSWNACILAYNPLVPAIVAAWAAKGMRLHFVPMYNATGFCGATNDAQSLCGGHKIHPSAAEYPKMASAFAISILQHYQ